MGALILGDFTVHHEVGRLLRPIKVHFRAESPQMGRNCPKTTMAQKLQTTFR
ncbi:MAG: hypothetical protein RLZZ618_3251 [Pseudomonadota bacterium]|jgi:hypothetical protein